MNRDIASIRRDYQLASLEEATCGALPMDQFERWWEEAIASNIDEVNAFVLSTITFFFLKAFERFPNKFRHVISSP